MIFGRKKQTRDRCASGVDRFQSDMFKLNQKIKCLRAVRGHIQAEDIEKRRIFRIDKI